MSKTLRTVGMVVAAVALVAATAGLAAPAVAATATTAATAGGIAGISAATLTAIGTYGALAAGVLSVAAQATAPGFSAQGNATTFQTNPQSGLPYVMGRTRMSGLRIYARTYDGFKIQSKDDVLAFVALLSIGGQIEQIQQFTADNEIVAFQANGNASGKFENYMSQKVSTGVPGAAALSMAFGGRGYPNWGADHKLSGITHAQWALRFDTSGDLYGAGAPEPAWIGKWVRVYDPRLDDTYPGGVGPCRALDESTYVWSENPGLHALTWALGRWQNGKRTCGIGAPIANIRVAEFVECANICEANAWTLGGVEWTTDTKWASLKRMLQAGGAVPTQTGAMIGCLVSTPRTAIATIESRHLLDGLTMPATKSRRDRYNTVIPRYVNEDNDWAVISGKAISVPAFVTADRGQRTKEIDFPLVQVFAGQEAKQPGQLAAYAIVNSREAGPFTWATGPEWIGLKTGDVIYLNVPEEGLVYQPILITKRVPDPASGKVRFAGDTETASKHPFALGQTTTPPAPFSLTAPSLKPPAPATSLWAVSGTTTGEGLPALIVVGTSEYPSADAVIIDYRAAGDTTWINSAIVSAAGAIQLAIAPLLSETLYEVRVGYRVGQIDGDFQILPATLSGAGKLSTIETGADVTGNHTAADTAAVAGRLAAELIAQSDVSTESILAESLRQDELEQVVDARTFVEGQPVSTKFLEFRNEQVTANAATSFSLALLGAQSPDGTAWNLNLDAVRVGPTETFAQRLTEIGLTTAQVTATAAFLLEVLTGPDGTESRAVIRVDNHGNMASIITTAGEDIGRIGLIAGQTVIAKADGTVLAAFGVEGDFAYVPNLMVDTLKVGAMDYEFGLKKTISAAQISQEFPGGLIMKTGRYRALINDETAMSIVFESPFPTECRSFIPVPAINSASIFRDLWIQLVGVPTRFGATIQTQSSTSNNNNIDGFDWTAWGT